MNKKINKIKGKALLLTLCVSLMSFAGCGGSNETSGNNETQAQTKQEMTTQESLSPKDMTVKAWLENLEIAGKKVGVPCKVSDMPDSITLEDGYIMPKQGLFCDFKYNGTKAGSLNLYDVYGDEMKFVDMSAENYKNEIIHSIYISVYPQVVDCFECVGVTVNDTRSSIVEKLGEPSLKEASSITYEYYDLENKYIASFLFNNDETMSSCLFYVLSESKEEK